MEPFAVINADEYYGQQSYQIIHDFLAASKEGESGRYCMVGFQLKKTVSEHGSVARGMCQVDENGLLKEIVEHTKIYIKDGSIVSEDDKGQLSTLEPMSDVSMNLFGFTPDFFTYGEEHFSEFIRENIDNPKAEFFIPLAVDRLINSGVARMTVLQTPDSWFGVTYQADKPVVLKAIRDLVDRGVYPESLWQK